MANTNLILLFFLIFSTSLNVSTAAQSPEQQRRPELFPRLKMTQSSAEALRAGFRGFGNGGDDLEAMRSALLTWQALRWGRRYDTSGRRLFWKLYWAFGAWNPKQLHKDIKKQTLEPRMSLKLTPQHTLKISTQKYSLQRNQGFVRTEVSPMPRHSRRLQPYYVRIRGGIGLAPMHAQHLDILLQRFMKHALSPLPNIKNVPVLFPKLQTQQSKAIAQWLSARLPRTTSFLHRYFHVHRIVTPMRKGMFKLDLQLQWNLKHLRADYARWVKKRKRSKIRIFFRTEFLNEHYQHWMRLSYSSRKRMYRIQAVVSQEGFHLCDETWNPIPKTKTWRPTQGLNRKMIMRSQLFYDSKRIRMGLSKLIFHLHVRPHKDGASLLLKWKRNPTLVIQGGRILRALARLVIPGGVSSLFQTMVRSLTKTSTPHHTRVLMRLVERPDHAQARFEIAFPVIPNRVLSSVLRLIPRQLGRHTTLRRKPKARRPRRVVTKRTKLRYRKRKRRPLPGFWKRFYLAISDDLRDAQKLLSASANQDN
ncbi:MAG: hypothetical protein AAGJ35_01530 [Myxococcota bacterium]